MTYAQVFGNAWYNVAWTINDRLKLNGITVEQIDEWLDTPEAQALPYWAWNIINAVMNNANNIEVGA